MILLVTPSERAAQCAAALNEATGEKISVAESLAQATNFLRAQSCLAVVLDQSLFETEPDEAAATIAHVGTAVVVPVNLALSGLERLVGEIRRALKRRRREKAVARDTAIAELHGELNGTVTALLLSIELALQGPAMSAEASGRLHTVLDLATKLRKQLEPSDTIGDLEQVLRS